MTTTQPPKPPIQARPVVAARPGALTRWKLSEPVRLYLYGLAVLAVLGLTMGGVLSGEWADYWLHVAAVVLCIAGPAEAVRASVYSPAGHVAGILRSRQHPSLAGDLEQAARW